MTPEVPKTCSTRSSIIAAQYEILRNAGFSEALPPEARSGLMLFLRCGMWGWAGTLAAAGNRQEPIPAPSLGLTESCEQTAIVHLFAAMAMNAKHRKAP